MLIIDPRTNRITQWETTGKRNHNPPRELAAPNDATPIDNGDILITEIGGAWITRITRKGNVTWSVQAPRMRYPSDAFPTVDG